jgi:hypothetical protein
MQRAATGRAEKFMKNESLINVCPHTVQMPYRIIHGVCKIAQVSKINVGVLRMACMGIGGLQQNYGMQKPKTISGGQITTARVFAVG